MPFFFTIAFVAVIFYFKHRRNRLTHETVRMMIEKGVPVTPEIIAALETRMATKNMAFSQRTRLASCSRG